MDKFVKISLSALFWIGTFLFWWLAYPQALSFMEQNQLFLFTWENLLGRLRVGGGFADYIADFLTQFSYVPVLGAAIMASLLMLMQLLVAASAGKCRSTVSYSLTFVPSLLMLLHFGDYFTLTCLPVAICFSLAGCVIYRRHPNNVAALVAIPLLLWLCGPAAWIYVFYLAAKSGRLSTSILSVLVAAAGVLVIRFCLMSQYPFVQVAFGSNYYAMKLRHPALQHVVIASAAVIPVLVPHIPEFKYGRAAAAVLFAILAGTTALFVPKAYDRTSYELIAYDQLIRAEKWEEVVKRAEKYQPKADIGCASVNLSLIMSDQIDRMIEFYQCGTRGLLMPRVRDFISNTSTGEAFFRMGMINEALRYAFDTQESIPSLKKSGRWLKRMAECQILNGRYEVASKYIDILKHTIFYRSWALEEEQYLGNMEKIISNNEYAYLLSIRPADDYLYYYPHMENQLVKLYFQNRNNLLAGSYLLAWHNLKAFDEDNE